MKFGKKVFCAALCAVLSLLFVLSGCNNPMFDFGGYEYPDFPYADSDPDIDSWTQWEEGDIIEIDWFIDSTSYSLPQESSLVVEEILRQTGVKINFRKATTSDGSELTTIIAGNDLPDLISVMAGMDDLVSNDKIFPINGLAERWAPSLWQRITEEGEMYNTYKTSDGDLFSKGLPRRVLFVHEGAGFFLDGRGDGESAGSPRFSPLDERDLFHFQFQSFRPSLCVRFERRLRQPRPAGPHGVFFLRVGR